MKERAVVFGESHMLVGVLTEPGPESRREGAPAVILLNAGLVSARREGRSIIYSIDFKGTRALLSFLMEDCCQGRPEVCSPALDSVLEACCT